MSTQVDGDYSICTVIVERGTIIRIICRQLYCTGSDSLIGIFKTIKASDQIIIVIIYFERLRGVFGIIAQLRQLNLRPMCLQDDICRYRSFKIILSGVIILIVGIDKPAYKFIAYLFRILFGLCSLFAFFDLLNSERLLLVVVTDAELYCKGFFLVVSAVNLFQICFFSIFRTCALVFRLLNDMLNYAFPVRLCKSSGWEERNKHTDQKQNAYRLLHGLHFFLVSSLI